jgi:hypothetical protein
MSEDPLGLQAGINFYRYVGDNPTNISDPSGMSNSMVHFNETYQAAVDLGWSRADALSLAYSVALVDVGTQGTDAAATRIHAMAGRKPNGNMESCQEAYQATVDFVNGLGGMNPSTSQIALALHAIQDSYSSSHQYQPWDGDLTWSHEESDWPTPPEAVTATQNFLRDIRDLGHPWGGGQYLNDVSVCSSGVNALP